MTPIGFAPAFTNAFYLPPEPEYATEEKFRETQIKRERLTATILNIKENATYEKNELLTAQQWFSTISTGGVIVTNYTFRLTFDLVSLNGGPIVTTTTITLPTDPAVNVPVAILYPNGLIPVHGFGAATVGTTYYFINDPAIYVQYINTSTTVQQIVINNPGNLTITQMYWVFEYIKF